ncbi:MAG: 2-amino-4-hydroxy-6-hydroxymethyldihydropteridine diphosphokinase [Bacteroidetes bacterium]|nr:2-amino-4-hydroxy-6-hydroxymethyldihydropteridine diphosphokinase [Bacteroidota bacterium]
MQHTVFICLGANIGDCVTTFEKAKKSIEGSIGTIKKISSLYQTQAWGMERAPDFFNQVLELQTTLTAPKLMEVLLQIESQLGRKRTNEPEAAYQNRVLDIDLLFFDTEIIQSPLLEVPHPKLHLRRFVLIPLQEIAPDFIHPLLKKSIAQLALACSDSGGLKKVMIA